MRAGSRNSNMERSRSTKAPTLQHMAPNPGCPNPHSRQLRLQNSLIALPVQLPLVNVCAALLIIKYFLSMVKNCNLTAVQSAGRGAVCYFAHARPIMLSNFTKQGMYRIVPYQTEPGWSNHRGRTGAVQYGYFWQCKAIQSFTCSIWHCHAH